MTAQRIAILRAVSARPHTTADELIDDVRSTIGSISRQAVYDTLALLVDKHLIRRIQPAGSSTRYEDRVDDNHHHLVCRGCSLMFDIDCAVGDTPCLTAADDHGFEIDEAEVVYWGRCPTCRTAAVVDPILQASATSDLSASNLAASTPPISTTTTTTTSASTTTTTTAPRSDS